MIKLFSFVSILIKIAHVFSLSKFMRKINLDTGTTILVISANYG